MSRHRKGMRSLLGVPFADVAHKTENERIRLICSMAMTKQTDGTWPKVAFIVDKGEGFEGKGDRYISKMKENWPDLVVASRTDGPVNGTESIIVQHKDRKD